MTKSSKDVGDSVKPFAASIHRRADLGLSITLQLRLARIIRPPPSHVPSSFARILRDEYLFVKWRESAIYTQSGQ
jgi:hypothetical protein